MFSFYTLELVFLLIQTTVELKRLDGALLAKRRNSCARATTALAVAATSVADKSTDGASKRNIERCVAALKKVSVQYEWCLFIRY